MCKWGNTIVVTLPTEHPTTQQRERSIDSCLVPLITALNAVGMYTTACCCGHGKRPGSVVLCDGRELHIYPDSDTGRRVDKLFPYPINNRRGAGVDRRYNPRGSVWLNEFGIERRKAERRVHELTFDSHD